MVMEKCSGERILTQTAGESPSGGELFDRLKDVQRFSEADAAGLVKQMFSAVNYCHEVGIGQWSYVMRCIVNSDGEDCA